VFYSFQLGVVIVGTGRSGPSSSNQTFRRYRSDVAVTWNPAQWFPVNEWGELLVSVAGRHVVVVIRFRQVLSFGEGEDQATGTLRKQRKLHRCHIESSIQHGIKVSERSEIFI